MSGSRVNIDYDELMRFINVLRSFNTTLSQEVSVLKNRLDELGKTWTDEEYRRFSDELNDLVRNLQKFQAISEEDTLPYLVGLSNRVKSVNDYYRRR